MNKSTKQRWALVFQCEGPGQTIAMRIKILLKAALRRYGLRCVDYWIIPADQCDKTGRYVRYGEQCDGGTGQNPTNGAKRGRGDVWGRSGHIDPEGVEL